MQARAQRNHFNGTVMGFFVNRYGTGTLTDVFLDRVFQECLTYEGEMVRKFLASQQAYLVQWKLMRFPPVVE